MIGAAETEVPERPAPAEECVSVLYIQPDGRTAEVVIDTGHRLRTGKSWRAYAKVYCNDPLHAQLMAERLKKRLGDAVEMARREAYAQGYADARARRARLRSFSREL
ncbi:MAG: hypothetical protein ACFBZ8_13815 [Opitutales bacterium]